MRIVKLRRGRRRIGEIVVPSEAVADVRDVATGVFEGYWTKTSAEVSVTSREPICQNATCTAYPAAPQENVYCYIATPDGIIEIPEREYLLKILQIL